MEYENTKSSSMNWGDITEIEDEKMDNTTPETSSDQIQAEEVTTEEQKNAPQESEEGGPRQYHNHSRGPPRPCYPYHGPPQPPYPYRGPPAPPNNRPSYQPYRGPPGPPHHGSPHHQYGPPRPLYQVHDRPPWMRDIESLKSKLRDRTGKPKEMSLELKDVSSKLEEEKETIAKLETENNKKEKKINDLLGWRTKEKLIGVIEAQNKNLQEKASGVSLQNKTLRAQKEVLEQDNKTLRAQKEVLEQDNKTLRAQKEVLEQ
ncbi:swi5-dependent recombination DNA repair protein 1 homolog [Cheilinus undulatus]|uniref:swi5-dependent recombination DNA repair protein 1 homolog n=1 Tax=Cheilinus undulatus TaxID=241271 RepID=UPI001BD51557|nr:swi5-dependent recombination DNA repair protein 1 homolog [Cheilinus undulatus]